MKNGRKQNVKQLVRSMLAAQLERKAIVSNITAAATPTAGTVLNLTNAIIQGDDVNQRSGDKVRCIKHKIRVNAQAIINSQTTRFIVFKDTQQNGTIPTVLDVLDNADYLSQYDILNVYQQKRFIILWDKVLDVNIAGESIKTVSKNLQPTGDIWYNGATAVNASNGRNSLFILIIASNSSGTYDYSWEMQYTDA